jgi:RNA polymerase sigma-70 factor (ECF subfamily)
VGGSPGEGPPGSDTGRLLAEARAGNRDALDALFARHRGRLLAFLRARMGPAAGSTVGAEDLLQETLLEAARKLGAFEDRGPASFYRWLVAIARFKVSEAGRARRAAKRSREEPLAADPPGRGTSPSGGAARAERADLLREALEGLPEAQAEAVRLRYLEGCTVAETAERLGRSPAAVKALVSRGLEGLGERLGGTLLL